MQTVFLMTVVMEVAVSAVVMKMPTTAIMTKPDNDDGSEGNDDVGGDDDGCECHSDGYFGTAERLAALAAGERRAFHCRNRSHLGREN